MAETGKGAGMRDTIIAIIAAQAMINPEEVTPESQLADLGLDSLGLVETIFAIEEAFDVSVPFNANAPEDLVLAEEILHSLGIDALQRPGADAIASVETSFREKTQ